MSEQMDLRKILQSWTYDPDNDARKLRGEDGREILQVRTPLGIEQHELDGRPDGGRPHGMESALEFYEHRLQAAAAAGETAEFKLDAGACSELFNEGTLYYLRYVRLFQLKDWRRTVRDTARNLRAFDLVHRYAQREEDQQLLERWRPYVIRVNAAAAAMMALEKREHEQALNVVDDAVKSIQALEDMDDETFQIERDRSLAAMAELAEQIQKTRPLSELEKLEQQLSAAIDRQEFERAAGLRDRIRALRKQKIC
jgi:hypothetical protein